jgi:hypothetical protein
METPTYGLIGRGRLAGHLARYLELEDRRVVRWHRGRSESAAECFADADVLLLAISDDAIESFVNDAVWSRGRLLVHFSGSLVVAGVHGLHPLMTFGSKLVRPRDLPLDPVRRRARRRRLRRGLSGVSATPPG